jgi:hypothetical protein
VSVSSLASQQRATRPHAGMECVRWTFAQQGDHYIISIRVKSATPPHLTRHLHFPEFGVVGVLIGREILIVKWEDRP